MHVFGHKKRTNIEKKKTNAAYANLVIYGQDDNTYQEDIPLSHGRKIQKKRQWWQISFPTDYSSSSLMFSSE